MAAELQRMVNDERAARGLPPLEWVPLLADFAHAWSEEMAARGRMLHSPAAARTPAGWQYTGENVWFGSLPHYGNVGAPHVALMNSGGHRANILQSGYDTIGIGVACVGNWAYVTQVFGRHDSAAARPVASGTPPSSPRVHTDSNSGTACGDPVDSPTRPSPVFGAPTVQRLVRVAGSNRFDTAARAATPSDRVIVASGENFPDAVAAASLASGGGTVLLVEHGRVPAETMTALAATRPSEILIMGGRAAVSWKVRDALRDATGATIRRIAGTSRVETAAEAAQRTPATGSVVIADSGRVFDAVVAAASGVGPLLLADQTHGLPETALDLLADTGVTRAVLVGIADANQVLRDQIAGLAIESIAASRSDLLSQTVAERLRGSSTAAVVASAESWPDALTAAGIAVARSQPLLLTMPDGSTDWSVIERTGVTELTVIGGPAAVPDAAIPVSNGG